MSLDTENIQSRAEFYLCLARAFLTPDSEQAWRGMREALADDLEELGKTLGYEIDNYIASYWLAIASVPDQPTLLQVYSALFLAPPRRVSINTGTYLDGALNGGSVLAMEEAYQRGGVARSEAFKDLSDHLSLQLEFVAHRFLARREMSDAETPDEDAEKFLDTFVARWLPPFIADLEREGTAPNPYLHLARILQAAVTRDARAAPLSAIHSRRQMALDKARHERGARGVTEQDMAFIAQCLREKGLSTDHLSIPPGQRDEARGLSKRVPPSPRRGSRLG